MTKELTSLEALKELKDEVVANYYQDQNWFDERYEIIETALKNYEELKIVAKPLTNEEKKSINSVARRLKALEIICKRKVDIWKLYDAINVSADAWKGHELHFYNEYFKHPNAQYRKLTQQEFDLLKEILK